MQPYIKHTSIAALMDRSNVDTDQIIPKNFMKKVERTGFGVNLFHNWRYLADNITPNPAFELNKPAFQGAKILVAGENLVVALHVSMHHGQLLTTVLTLLFQQALLISSTATVLKIVFYLLS